MQVKQIYVAIGSSAGGLEALQELLPLLETHTHVTYIIAQHHAITHKSMLASIIERTSTLPTLTIESGISLEQNIFYILPAHLKLTLEQTQEGERVTAHTIDDNSKRPLPSIDALFSTLASAQNTRTIALLLSGTGEDGTQGMIDVKKSHGLTIVQSPQEALYTNMVKAPINAGVVDYILNINEIPNKLTQLFDSILDGSYQNRRLPLDYIYKEILQQKHLNLSKYKEETLLRRIKNRIEALHLSSIEEYGEYFSKHPAELDILFNKILIGVTSFFRDAKAFEALAKQLKKRLENFPLNAEFRLWSIACATGEEAYSLAILLDTLSIELNRELKFKIFASDINNSALSLAREGVYTYEALSHLEPKLLQTYFDQKIKGKYQIKKELRKRVIFASHNFIEDPPFINIDLISCRNVLIYLIPSTQSDFFHLAHYALNEQGLLFLGSSESTIMSIEEFKPLSTNLYQKEGSSSLPKLPSKFFSSNRQKQANHGESMTNPIDPTKIEQALHNELFGYFAPKCIVIDKNHTILYKKGRIPYLHFSDGIISLNILQNLDAALQYEATLLLNHAITSNKYISSKFVEMGESEKHIFVRMIAKQFHISSMPSMILIYFQELELNQLRLNGLKSPLLDEDTLISTLSSQLSEARGEVKELSDELLFLKQNMGMINAQLQESNEKLQSTVEEFETSNQELQASNEELRIALDENFLLQQKLSHIFSSSLEGIMILDRDARHTFVNEKAAELLGYTQEELINKKAHQLWHHTKPDGSFYPESECPVVSVLKHGEKRRGNDLFWRKDGSSFDVSFSRTPLIEKGEITGALLFFHDISDSIALEKRLKYEHQLTATYLDLSGLLVMSLDLKGDIVSINRAGLEILKLTHEEAIGKNWFQNYLKKSDMNELKEYFKTLLCKKTKAAYKKTNHIIDAQGESHLISWRSTQHLDKDGKIIGLITTGNDITNEELLVEQLNQSSREYETTFKAAQIGIARVGLNGEWLDVNEYLANLVGYTKEELLMLKFEDITHPHDITLDSIHFQRLLAGEEDTYATEKRYIHKSGDEIWIYLSVVLIRDENWSALYFISTIQDITKLKLLMLEVDEKRNELENIIKFAPNPIMLYDEDGSILLTNEIWKSQTGYFESGITTIEEWIERVLQRKIEEISSDATNMQHHYLQVQDGEYTIHTKNGDSRTWVLSSIPIGKHHNGKLIIIIAAMDITALQKNEELMLAQSRQAAMGDMIGMIAHQWRQPLTVISMVSNNLRAHLELEDEIPQIEIEKLTKVLSEQTQYLSDTIDDFRNFFKPDKKKERITLCELYTRLDNIVAKALQNNQIKFSTTQECQKEIYTFSNELIQVLINLINNAKDAIKEHNIEDGAIEVGTELSSNYISIVVSDNGGGISKSIINKLGEPYVTTKNTTGTGLGLYMSKIIIEKHLHGSLKWENRKSGALFTITLPEPKDNTEEEE